MGSLLGSSAFDSGSIVRLLDISDCVLGKRSAATNAAFYICHAKQCASDYADKKSPGSLVRFRPSTFSLVARMDQIRWEI
jgi:hypothetical protein